MEAQKATREAYGEVLVELGREFLDIVSLDADLSSSTMTKYFAKEFPDRFFQCGLGEQNMVSIAAGLAASGKIPFVSTFAVFASCRCFDQLRMSISQPKLNVKIAGTHGGITVGEDGASHHAIEDIALFCALPSFTVVVPADAIETVQLVRAAATAKGPFYIRLGRPKVPYIYNNNCKSSIGKAVMLRDGKDATIIANGTMVSKALEAANNLARQRIECRVLNMHTIKPLDEDAILSAARQTGVIVTAEEHLLHGGLGSRIAQIIVQHIPVPMTCIGLKDIYAKSGKPDELLKQYGLSSDKIENAVKTVVERK